MTELRDKPVSSESCPVFRYPLDSSDPFVLSPTAELGPKEIPADLERDRIHFVAIRIQPDYSYVL